MWWLFNSDNDDADDEDGSEKNSYGVLSGNKEKKISVTPSFGVHYFWYKRHLCYFRRSQDERQGGYCTASEREEIAICCFGRNPAILRELLEDCRTAFTANDKNKTIIYRGTLKSGSTEPTWRRCMSRLSRPISTVVLDEAIKQRLILDMDDYLMPATKRWYSNRGIPYRRGYLLHGPPGTGKSSLSFAIAGHFKLKIYIV